MTKINSSNLPPIKRPSPDKSFFSTTNDPKRQRLVRQGSATLEGLKSFPSAGHDSGASSVASGSSDTTLVSANYSSNHQSAFYKLPPEVWAMISIELSDQDNLSLEWAYSEISGLHGHKNYAALDRLFKDKSKRVEFFRTNPPPPKGSYLSHYYQLMYESLRTSSKPPETKSPESIFNAWSSGVRNSDTRLWDRMFLQSFSNEGLLHIRAPFEDLEQPTTRWKDFKQATALWKDFNQALNMQQSCLVKGHIPTVAKLLSPASHAEPRQCTSSSADANLAILHQANLLSLQMLERSKKLKVHQKEKLASSKVILNLARGVIPNLEALSKVSKDTMNQKFADIQDPEQRKAVIESNIFWDRGGPTLEAVIEYINSKDKTQCDLSNISLQTRSALGKKLELIEALLEYGIAPDSLYSESADTLHIAIYGLYRGMPGALQTIKLILEKESGPNVASKLEDYFRFLVHVAECSLELGQSKKLKEVLEVMQLLLKKSSIPEIGRLDKSSGEINRRQEMPPHFSISLPEEMPGVPLESMSPDNTELFSDTDLDEEMDEEIYDVIDLDQELGESRKSIWQDKIIFVQDVDEEEACQLALQLTLQFTEFMLDRTTKENWAAEAQKTMKSMEGYGGNAEAELGILKFAEFFLKKGISPDHLKVFDEPILFTALDVLVDSDKGEKEWEIFESFLESLPPLINEKDFINEKNEEKQTALYRAVNKVEQFSEKSFLWLIDSLLKKGADPTILHENNETALILATKLSQDASLMDEEKKAAYEAAKLLAPHSVTQPEED